MSIKKAIFCLIIICLLLSSCANDYELVSADSSKNEFILGTSSGVLYVVNIATRSYHLPDCYMLKRTDDKNKETTSDIDFLQDRGYSPCKICFKEIGK